MKMFMVKLTTLVYFNSIGLKSIWYYNPNILFTKEKIDPGFFLETIDNTGDYFSYFILPVKNYCNIPKHHRTTILVRSIVRKGTINNEVTPTHIEYSESFKFENSNTKELIDPAEIIVLNNSSSIP